ncbi:hypothetical protein NA57DRAFT_61703 [Rhizodiscina lignyota]|uniref:Uncharacterized protein n=1 Tax=Rhizodiscina lignyota TaxID=1504668 RepID=A0A9P4I483_9PEZI|nr:hypothetical protein NA57DRAFT_61703 [Rhizodiscina lignyota]
MDESALRAKKKRKLNYSKCFYCRRDKKRVSGAWGKFLNTENNLRQCEPTSRQWPGKKCTRCEDEQLPCSANETRKASSGGGCAASQPFITPLSRLASHSNDETYFASLPAAFRTVPMSNRDDEVGSSSNVDRPIHRLRNL